MSAIKLPLSKKSPNPVFGNIPPDERTTELIATRCYQISQITETNSRTESLVASFVGGTEGEIIQNHLGMLKLCVDAPSSEIATMQAADTLMEKDYKDYTEKLRHQDKKINRQSKSIKEDKAKLESELRRELQIASNPRGPRNAGNPPGGGGGGGGSRNPGNPRGPRDTGNPRVPRDATNPQDPREAVNPRAPGVSGTHSNEEKSQRSQHSLSSKVVSQSNRKN